MDECTVEVKVQTTLPEPLYEALRRLAKSENRPLKAVVRAAIEAYLRLAVQTANDPPLDFVGHGRLKGQRWSERKDRRA